MKKPLVTLLLVAVGVCLGVAASFIGFLFLVGHPKALSRLVGLSDSGIASAMDPSKRLAKAEAELHAAHGDYQRWCAMTDAALLNAESGSQVKAKAYAAELLETSKRYPRDWNFGNAIHKGNLALGLVALKAGDLAEAKKDLLAAGRTPGSPQLDSFGPNMVLAKELAAKGEKETVIEYLNLCGNFWKMDYGKLREWKALVKDGVVPDFGANLLY